MHHPMLIFFSEIVAQVPFNRVRVLEQLATGSFSDIYKACVSNSGIPLALKIITHARGGHGGAKMSLEESKLSIENELDAHREIRSAFLCKLFGYSMHDGKVCLLLELMDNGSLIDVLRKENQG